MMHARQRTNARLQRRRRKVAEEKVAKVLREVRAEIQEANAKKRPRSNEPPTVAERKGAAEEPEEGRQHRHEQVLGLQTGEAKERNEYECPYCHAKTYSGVRTGGSGRRALRQAVSCSKWGRRTFVHPCLPQLWHDGPVGESVRKTTDQTPEA